MYIFNICEEEPTQYLIKYWKQFSHWKHLIDKNSVHVLSKCVTMLGPLDDFASFLNLPNGTIVHPSSPFQGWFVKVGDRLCERTVNLHLNMNQISIDFHLERNSKYFWFVKINCQLRLPYINNIWNVLFLFDKLLLHNCCPFNLLTLNFLVIGLIFVYGWGIIITKHWKPPQDADQQPEN